MLWAAPASASGSQGHAVDVITGQSPRRLAAIRLDASLPHLLLGRDAGLELRITADPRLEDLVVTTNIGRLGELRAAGAGAFVIGYQPPDQLFPGVAIVSAVGWLPAEDGAAARSVFGWTAIELWARGTAMVMTRPHAEISVRIADKIYGPVKADARGTARVPVIVPPGAREGYDGDRPVPLGLPDTPHLHVALGRSQVRADREEEIAVQIMGVNAAGAPRPDCSVTLQATRGAPGDLRQVTPGVLATAWRLPPGSVGSETLTVRMTDEALSVETVEVAVRAGPPAKVSLVAHPSAVVARENLEVELAVAMSDAAGNPTGELPGARPSLGEVSAVEVVAPGSYRARWRLPPNFGGATEARVEITVGEESRVAASATIALGPAEPDQIELSPRTGELRADGEARLAIGAVVVDRFGNRIPGLSPTARTESGETSAVSPGPSPGEYRVIYTAPESFEAGSAEVEVAAAGLRATSTVSLVGAPARLALAPKLGLLTNFNDFHSPFFAAEGMGWFTLAGEEFGAGLETGFLLSRRNSTLAQGLRVSASSDLFALAAVLGWRKRLADRWLLWVAGGGGFATIHSRVAVDGQGEHAELGVAPVVQASVGAGYWLWRGAPFLEVGFRWQGDAGLRTAVGDLPALTINAGYRFEFF